MILILIYFTIKKNLYNYLIRSFAIPPRHEIVNIIKQNVNLVATSHLSLAITR